MELWIRSQDRKRLIKGEKLITVEFTEQTECEIWNDTVKLGTYKNTERALEVLDEIQTIIRGQYATSFDFKIALKGFQKEEVKQMLEQMAVYEMPKD